MNDKPKPYSPAFPVFTREDADRIRANFPPELLALLHWVAWQWIKRPRDPKPTKKPINPQTGMGAESDNPQTWVSFEQAAEFALRRKIQGGIGFMFAPPIVGIDFDHCIEEGAIDSKRLEFVNRLHSYTEYSPSKTGLHTICKGSLPPSGRKQTALEIEVYSEGRFFTVTGERLNGFHELKDCSEVLREIHAEWFPPKQAPAPKSGESAQRSSHNSSNSATYLDDQELLRRMFASTKGAKILALWRGDTSGYNGDDSAADLAFVDALARWTDYDELRTDSLFRQSGLMRSKWDDKRPGGTYGTMTIAKAFDGKGPGDGYSPRVKRQDTLPYDAVKIAPVEMLRNTPMCNSERFVALYGDWVKYSPKLGVWFVWDGKRWERDISKVAVFGLAKRTIRGLYETASQEDDDKDRKALVRWAQQCESDRALNEIVSLAEKTADSIHISPDAFDTLPFKFNVDNGTVDLQTRSLDPHDKKLLLTQISHVVFDPAATCSEWLKFLDRIMGGDKELISYLQRALGYSLSGDTSERVLFICHGSGRNGKTTLFDVMKAILGDYQATAKGSVLFPQSNQDDKARPDILALKGRRLAETSELIEGAKLDESFVKNLTGGRDEIAARFMRSDEIISFIPTFKIWIRTNYEPRIKGTDKAIWDRVHYIPFGVRIEDNEVDSKLPEKLKGEASGILNWCLEGFGNWWENARYGKPGLKPPQAVLRATADYQFRMDALARFIDECCVVAEIAECTSKELYEVYIKWCQEGGEHEMTRTMFGRKLSEKGFNSTRPAAGANRSKTIYYCIGIREEDETLTS